MNADNSDSSISRAKKREKLMALIERKKSGKRHIPEKGDDTNCKISAKENIKLKKLNALSYKNQTNDAISEEYCSGSRHKKPRLCSGQGRGKTFQQSRTKDRIESGSAELSGYQFQVSTEIRNHVLPYVNKLRDHWNRGQNAVFFDGQDRLIKVVFFVLSLLDNLKKPILIINASNILSLWEIEFSKWSKLTKVVTYKGNKDVRATIRDLKFQVLLSSPDVIVEDLEMLDHIKWELLVIDECQRPTVSTQFRKFKMLAADMKLLTVTCETVDIKQSYRNILSLLDPKYEEMHTDADMETNNNIHALRERLSPFIAFECKSSPIEFKEYWVPVHLSSMQIEQYCSNLVSNMEALSSCPRNSSSLHDILTQIQKCCDHPYLVDPTLRNSSKKDASIDPLDAEINVSGKLHVLDKLLLEIKRCSLRVVVLFQSAVNSEKISTGHFLDDLVHQRFGQNSYVYIPGKILSNSAYTKKKESLKMFNNVESERFICLFDYRACHSSIRLSHVDVVILFNSDWNPSNDIKALQRITIDSHCERLKVLRLYSSFTIEEKALILSKQGTTIENYISSSVCHQLLAWGTSYLFKKLQSGSHEWQPPSFIDDLVHELSSLLSNRGVKTGSTKLSLISNAKLRNGAYSRSILLLGEAEAHTKESSLVEKNLIENGPLSVWSNLVKQSQHRPKNSCNKFSRRVQNPPQNACYCFEGENQNDATTSIFIRRKLRSKRKTHDKLKQSKGAGLHRHFGGHQSSENVIEGCTHQGEIQGVSHSFNLTDAQLPITPSASISDSVGLNPRTNEGQQSQNNQPQNTYSATPLDTEIERIQKEQEQVTKSHQEKKSVLLSECEKEISEVRKKYDALIKESEMSLTKQIKILEDYLKLVNANKLLAEILAQNCLDTLNLKKTEKETSWVKILQIPPSALVRPANPYLTSSPTTCFSGNSLGGSELRAPACHLRSNTSLFASSRNRPAKCEPFLEPLPTLSTSQTLPCIQTESNNGVYQVNGDNLSELPVEFDRFYDTGDPILSFLGSNYRTF